MFDVAKHLGAVTRAVEDSTHEGTPVKVVVASRTYPTDVDDLWDAVTDPARIARWFAPVTGDLRLGELHELYLSCGVRRREDTVYMRSLHPGFEVNTSRW